MTPTEAPQPLTVLAAAIVPGAAAVLFYTGALNTVFTAFARGKIAITGRGPPT